MPGAGCQVEGAGCRPGQGAACRRRWSDRAGEGLGVLERRPRAAEERPSVGSPRQSHSRLVLQVAKATLGQFGKCLSSCSGCRGAGHGVGLMWGERWGFGVSMQNWALWGRATSKVRVPQRSEDERQGQGRRQAGGGRGLQV